MIQIITKYYRLFEVQLLHEYFLIGENKLIFFTESQAQRAAILKQRVHLGHYRIENDLLIIPTTKTKEILRNHRLKFKQTAIGFIIGVEGIMTDGKVAPKIALTDALALNFKIQVLNPIFKNYSLLPFKRNTEGNYFFSNIGQPVKDTEFKSLSQPVPNFQIGTEYVAGEITNHAGVLREAESNTNSSNYWNTIGGIGYVNENDRRYYPKSFFYSPKNGLGNYSFELKDKSGNTLKSIEESVTTTDPIRLDFSRVKSINATGNGQTVPLLDGIYKLNISTPDNIEEKLIFLSSEYEASDFGMVTLQMRVEEEAYNILDEAGHLIINPHPTFEIRLRSRRTFWRYQAQNQNKLLKPVTNNDATFFIDANNQPSNIGQPTKYLITKIPQKMASLPINIIEPGGTKEFFPQPRPSPFRQKRGNELFPNNEPRGRIYSDIFITSINGKIDIV